MDTCSTFKYRAITTRAKQNVYGVRPMSHKAVVLGKFVLTWGGDGPGVGPVYRYDTVREEWEVFKVGNQMQRMSPTRAMFVVEDCIYALFPHPWRVMKLDAVLMDEIEEAFRSSILPYPEHNDLAEFLQPRKEIVILAARCKDVWLWHLYSQRVYRAEVSGAAPMKINSAACCSYGNKVFVAGGQRPAVGIGLHILDANGTVLRWSKPTVSSFAPSARHTLSLSCSGPNRVFAYGGYGAADELLMYGVKERKWTIVCGRSSPLVPYDTTRLQGGHLPYSLGQATVQTEHFLLALGGYKADLVLSNVYEIRPQ